MNSNLFMILYIKKRINKYTKTDDDGEPRSVVNCERIFVVLQLPSMSINTDESNAGLN